MKFPDFILSEPIGFHLPALAAWMVRHQRLSERMQSAQLGSERLTISDFVNARRPAATTEQGIAVIHVNEALSRTATNFDKLLGDTHYNDVISELAQAAGDAAVRGIFLDVSSPGGSAIGAPEAAQAVFDARQAKPVVSYIETVGASAAYFLASASNAIVASPSAVVGSIGTISTFFNYADLLHKIGIDVNIITPAGADLKASGNPYREMTRAEEAFLQARVESINQGFTSWVQSQRHVATASMRGQYFAGTDAIAHGLIDQTGSRADAMGALEALIAYTH